MYEGRIGLGAITDSGAGFVSLIYCLRIALHLGMKDLVVVGHQRELLLQVRI